MLNENPNFVIDENKLIDRFVCSECNLKHVWYLKLSFAYTFKNKQLF